MLGRFDFLKTKKNQISMVSKINNYNYKTY